MPKPKFLKPIEYKLHQMNKNFEGKTKIDRFIFMNEIIKYGDEDINHMIEQYPRRVDVNKADMGAHFRALSEFGPMPNRDAGLDA